jgi:hypothetical protein
MKRDSLIGSDFFGPKAERPEIAYQALGITFRIRS